MLYIAAIILGIAIGIMAKGKAANLLELNFEKVWLIMIAFVIQIFTQIMGNRGFTFAAKYSFVIQAVVFCMLLAGFWFNRRYLGIWVIGAGCGLNALVMMLNGGKMPVSYEMVVKAGLTGMVDALKAGADGKHIIISQSTRLAFLSDIIHLPKFIDFGMQIVSIGDLIVLVGLFLLVVGAVAGKKLEMKN